MDDVPSYFRPFHLEYAAPRESRKTVTYYSHILMTVLRKRIGLELGE
jgi:hypothetical protein